MSVKRVASRYAKSLLDLAVERNQEEVVLSDIMAFKKALESKDLVSLVKSPIVNTGKKKEIFSAIFGDKLDKLTYGFMDILLSKGREALLPEMVDEYILQHKLMKKISSATITVAAPMSDEKLNEIKAKMLDSKVTLDTVDLDVKVDPSILGGFIIKIGDKLYDASVKHNLEKLKKNFINNDYVATI